MAIKPANHNSRRPSVHSKLSRLRRFILPPEERGSLVCRRAVRSAAAGPRGITLIETVVGLGVFILLAVAVLAFQKDFFQLNRFLSGGLDRETEIRKVFKNFVAEVRSASPSSVGGYLVEQASASSLTFFSDIDGDGLKERLRYFLDGATLQRGVIKPSGTPLSYVPASETVSAIAQNITGPASIFSYYDSAYDGTGSPLSDPPSISAIRLVRLTLVIDPNDSRPPGPTTFTTQATIRNLKASD